MEECALAFGLEAILTDKGRFAALVRNADHVALVTVDALRAALQRLTHTTTNQYKLLFNFTIKMGHQPTTPPNAQPPMHTRPQSLPPPLPPLLHLLYYYIFCQSLRQFREILCSFYSRIKIIKNIFKVMKV